MFACQFEGSYLPEQVLNSSGLSIRIDGKDFYDANNVIWDQHGSVEHNPTLFGWEILLETQSKSFLLNFQHQQRLI